MAGRHMHLLVALCLTTLIVSQAVNAAPPPSEFDTAKDSNNNDEILSGVLKQLTEAENEETGSIVEHSERSVYKAGKKCLPGWRMWNGACYFFNHNFKNNWYDARVDCVRKSQGRGDLASIHSQAENDFLERMAGTSTPWIGFSLNFEVHREQNFRWSDNTQRGYTNWNTETNEPNNASQECTQMGYDDGMHHGWSGKWNDARCSTLLPYICKEMKF